MTKEFCAFLVDENKKAHHVAKVGSDLTEFEVGNAVLALAMQYGTAKISIYPEPDIGPYALTLYAEDGKYLILLGEYLADGEGNVRTLCNALCDTDNPNKLVLMHGEMFPNTITRNIHSVVDIFVEFYRTGDVSRNLMD